MKTNFTIIIPQTQNIFNHHLPKQKDKDLYLKEVKLVNLIATFEAETTKNPALENIF